MSGAQHRFVDDKTSLLGYRPSVVIGPPDSGVQRVVGALCIAFVLPFLVGCDSYLTRVFAYPELLMADVERLPEERPETYSIGAPAGPTHRTLSHLITSRPNCHILVDAPNDCLITWIERDADWEAIERPVRSLFFGLDSEGMDIIPDKPVEGIALTTSRIRPVSDETCMLSIRRSCYSTISFHGWAYSNGDYERRIVEELEARLALR